MNDDNLSRTSGVTDVQGDPDAGGAAPPPGTAEQQAQAADALEHPRLGGDASSPTGLRDNEADEQVGAAPANDDDEGAQGRDFANEAANNVDDFLDNAEAGIEKLIHHNAGEQVDAFTPEEADAVGRAAALLPHLSVSAAPAIQQSVNGGAPPTPNNRVLQDLEIALRFIRMLKGL